MQDSLFPTFPNPFRPGAGHMPPHLAGRNANIAEFKNLLKQDLILENLVVTGPRGVGKTVLLETIKPIAVAAGWVWIGADLSQSVSSSEQNFATRVLTDLSIATSSWPYTEIAAPKSIGFESESASETITLNFTTLASIYNQTPGLQSDKLKRVLGVVAQCMPKNFQGVLFAYDESQNLSDHPKESEYPLSLMLDVFQSIQRMKIPFMLILAGLPTLFPKLVEARTYAERMFRVMFLDSLADPDSREAISLPIANDNCPVQLTTESIETIVKTSAGYPYFIQFICREVYDAFIQQHGTGTASSVPLEEIVRKLDTDFFAGRWARATDRQRELLNIIASLENCDSEFSVQEIVEASKRTDGKAFSNSHANQMLSTLCANGLVYKNRYGKYSFAVPLFGGFIRRQMTDTS